MYCQKCGKELKEGEKCCECSKVDTKIFSRLNWIICTIIGVIGGVFSLLTLIYEIQHSIKWRGGPMYALKELWNEQFWIIPIAFISVIFLIAGIFELFGKNDNK